MSLASSLSTRTIAIGLFIVAIVAVVVLGAHQRQSAQHPPSMGEDDTPLALQVPLMNTVTERQEFMTALKAWPSRTHFRDLYDPWIDKIGANGIIDTVQTFDPECHDAGHDLGRLIYHRLGSVGDALRVCADSCNSGCMHGVLMEFFTKNVADVVVTATTSVASGTSVTIPPTSTVTSTISTEDSGEGDHVTLADVKEKITSICGSATAPGNPIMSSNYKQGDCVHGVGHAVMFLSNYDIPTAMKYCQLLDSPVLSYYCATGAYMEYETNHDLDDALSHPDDPFFPCDQTTFPAACFHYKMPHLTPRYYQSGKTLTDLDNACLALQGKYQVGCFHGIGNGNYVGVALKRMTLATVCNTGSHDDMYACTEGLMERLGRYEPAFARSQCDTVDGWQKQLCLDDVQHELYDLTKPFSLYVP